eukprot:361382-Chlamydomonas_euryale.AAC.8
MWSVRGGGLRAWAPASASAEASLRLAKVASGRARLLQCAPVRFDPDESPRRSSVRLSPGHTVLLLGSFRAQQPL